LAQVEHPSRARFLSRATIREMTIVVLSILIAFGLDATWERVSRHSALRGQLPSVISEMRASRAALDLAIRAHERQGRIAGGLAAMLRATPAPHAVSVSDTLVGPLFPQFTMDLSTSALESFIEAGGLDLLAEADLRDALLAWPTEIDDARDDEIFLRTYPAAQLASYLRENFDVGAAELRGGPWLRATSTGQPVTDLEIGVTMLRADQSLFNLLASRESHELAMLQTLLPLRESADDLIMSLEQAR